MPFQCQCQPVSLWRWPLTCNLEKYYSLRSSFGMYNLERRLRYLHLLTRHCPCNLLPEPTSPKHEYRGKLWGHPVTSSMMSSPWKFFRLNLGRSFSYLRSNWSYVFFQNFENGRHFEVATNFFYRKWYRNLNIPERWPLAFPTFWAFDRRSNSNIDGDISISKFDIFCDLVTSSMTSWVREA